MMKKVLAYAMTAILLGTVVMLTPLLIIRLVSGDGETVLGHCPQVEILDGEHTLTRGALNLLSAGLLLFPSFIIAFGAFLFLKRRWYEVSDFVNTDLL